MAIDPDVAVLLDQINAQLADLQDPGTATGAHTHPTGDVAADRGIRYVAEDGNTDNDGLSWTSPMASPQTAYDSLVDFAKANFTGDRFHVGVIEIGRGFFDLGDRLELQRNYSATFLGKINTRLQTRNIESTTVLGSTSTTAKELVVIPGIAANSNAYGFKFVNLGFRPQPQMTAVLRTNDANFTSVIDCFARPPSGELDGFFIVCDGEWDNSWWDIQGNRIQDMGFIRTDNAVTNNQNRWYVANNQIFCSNSNLRGMLDLKRVSDSTFIGNNLEGDMVAVYAESCGNCSFINNSGESSSIDHAAYVMPGGWWNIIMGGRFQTQTSGIFLDRSAGGSSVTVINPQATLTTRTDGSKNRIIDPAGTVTLVGGFV